MLVASAGIEKIGEVSMVMMKKMEEFASCGLKVMLVCEEARIDIYAAGVCGLFRYCEEWTEAGHDLAGMLTSLWCASVGAERVNRPAPALRTAA